ncbi:MAG: aminotransferase class V-fold PLP-dependent enzyme [Oscillospiraceae bacterium]|nr:aminotransferase class V-fold PLP-dependent enzyme [Oscillospiraceae bacterium]
MKTPVCDFIRDYIQKDVTRLHMPGHKGVTAPGDITEVTGADVLYHAEGILKESQENASHLFGTAKTIYSTEGSSLSIRAMLCLLRMYVGRTPVIAAGRNAHKTFVTAAALLHADVRWLWPAQSTDLLSCRITAEELDGYLQNHSVDAVYITSPDYLGNVADIAALAQVCHSHHALLLVDNAHGAYLRFLKPSRHPIDLGADLCCDSAHKTLPVLTGGGYLHIANPGFFADQAQKAMSLYASTSPSYLILESLDACNAYLAETYPAKLQAYLPMVKALQTRLEAAGYVFMGQEPMKLTIAAKAYGYTGVELGQLLESQNLICEFADPDYLVLMLSPENGEAALEKLETVLLSIPQRDPILTSMPTMAEPTQAMPMADAILQAGEPLPLARCEGRILASPTVSCPPAIPVLVCGERVEPDAMSVMAYYGITELNVI